MYFLYLVGPLVEQLYGSIRFVLLYVITAAAGSAASFLFGGPEPSVGASGAIFGLCGVLLAVERRPPPHPRPSRAGDHEPDRCAGRDQPRHRLRVRRHDGRQHRQRRPRRRAARRSVPGPAPAADPLDARLVLAAAGDHRCRTREPCWRRGRPPPPIAACWGSCGSSGCLPSSRSSSGPSSWVPRFAEAGPASASAERADVAPPLAGRARPGPGASTSAPRRPRGRDVRIPLASGARRMPSCRHGSRPRLRRPLPRRPEPRPAVRRLVLHRGHLDRHLLPAQLPGHARRGPSMSASTRRPRRRRRPASGPASAASRAPCPAPRRGT